MLDQHLSSAYFLGYVQYGNWRTTVWLGWAERPSRGVCVWIFTWRRLGALVAPQPSVPQLKTWLILPVVIRSSQRLSHACVSSMIWPKNCEWLIISVIVYLIVPYYLDTRSNSRANTCVNTRPLEEWYLLDWNQPVSAVSWWFIITFRIALQHFIQVSALSALTVVYWTTVALTGNGGLGFDSGEGAWETATTSKEGSRRVNYPILTQGGSDNK